MTIFCFYLNDICGHFIKFQDNECRALFFLSSCSAFFVDTLTYLLFDSHNKTDIISVIPD